MKVEKKTDGTYSIDGLTEADAELLGKLGPGEFQDWFARMIERARASAPGESLPVTAPTQKNHTSA
jgi:hypothetical protein